MSTPVQRPTVGISACLLGEAVRYDGGHKLEPAAVGALAQSLLWVPLCPEVEMGLGVPREPIRVERDGGFFRGSLRLRAVESRRDLTEDMVRWARAKLRELSTWGLCGLVLKARSPSCGVGSTPIYRPDGRPVAAGDGFFAAALRAAWPDLPLLDEEGLRQDELRELFVKQVMARWRAQGTGEEEGR